MNSTNLKDLDSGEATVANDQAIKVDPNDARPYYNKGAALIALGKNDEAIVAYDQANKALLIINK